MPIYIIFLIVAIAVALCSDKIDKAVKGNGKLKKVIIVSYVAAVIVTSIIIKLAL